MDLNKPHIRYKKQTPRQRTWTIHFIALEKIVKGTVLIIVAFRLLTLFDRDVHAWAADFVTRHGVDIANRYVQNGLTRLVGVGNTQLVELSVVAIVYAGVLYVEGIGLWLQKRWAEYLTAISTSLLIPFELYELYERFTWVRIAILTLNIFIVWYLVTRLRDEKRERFTTETTVNTERNGTRVKICGITNLEDARLAIKCGADELGFNFHNKSPRYIPPEKAAEIIRKLPKDIIKVGVFVNEPVSSLLEITQYVGLDGIQLHGDEQISYVRELMSRTDRFVIKAFRLTPSFSVGDAMDWPAHYQLFDAYSPNARGGTGQTFDWENFATDVFVSLPYSVYVAGGLTPENVAEAIRTVRMPHAVDVASGVESSPGKKDPKKVEAFIRNAKAAL